MMAILFPFEEMIGLGGLESDSVTLLSSAGWLVRVAPSLSNKMAGCGLLSDSDSVALLSSAGGLIGLDWKKLVIFFCAGAAGSSGAPADSDKRSATCLI
jgi:hypothetical protein